MNSRRKEIHKRGDRWTEDAAKRGGIEQLVAECKGKVKEFPQLAKLPSVVAEAAQ
jgi:hypothetical protein